MSCGIASSMMVMRAEVRRSAAGKDSYGHQKPGSLQFVQDGMPCFVFVKTIREVVDGKDLAVEAVVGYFRHDADLERDDRIEQVKDRRDRTVIDGPLIVDTIVDKLAGASPSYKEAVLRRVRG